MPKALVSFGIDEDEDNGFTVVPSAKKRKRENGRTGGEDEKTKENNNKVEKKDTTVNIDVDVDNDDMWVEKPVNFPPSGMSAPWASKDESG